MAEEILDNVIQTRPNSGIIIQQVYHNSAYTDLLLLTLPRTMAYCKAHDFDLDLQIGNIVPEWDIKEGGWAKLALIIRAMTAGYQYIVWLDADCVIADMSADLRDGCPKPQGVGVTFHPAANGTNVGMLYITNGQETFDFLRYWVQWYPGPAGGWHEQMAFILLEALPCFAPLIQRIDAKWNSCRAGGTRVDNPAVEGFHGEGPVERRIELMREYLQSLQAQ